jgi:hypothetical protein
MDTPIDFARPQRAAAFMLLGVSGANATLGVDVARSWRARLRGWLGRREAPASRGLWLVPCDSVHTFAMRFPVDLVFVNATGRILRVDHRVPPWRVRFCLGAYSVIELAAGRAEAMKLLAGDQLERVRV